MANNVRLLDAYGILYIGTSEFYFDIEDLYIVQSRTNWYVDKGGYLTSSYYYAGVRRIVRFHRIVMHAGPNQYVDHKNRNRYDNRKSNLRCCTYAENNRNRGLCVTNKSGVIGVHFDKNVINGQQVSHLTAKRFLLGALKIRKLQFKLVSKKNMSYSESLLHNKC